MTSPLHALSGKHGRTPDPAENKIKILMLEDVETDAALVECELRRGGINFEARRVDREEEFLRELEAFAPHIVLADYTLPHYDGLSALDAVLRMHPEIPLIFVSGTMGEEFAVEGLKQGATDYILKHRLSGLVPSIHRALREAEEYAKRKSVERALCESERKFRVLFNSANDAITVRELNERGEAGKFIEVNEVACAQLGYTKEELLSFTAREIESLEHTDGIDTVMARLSANGCVLYEAERNCKDSCSFAVEINAHLCTLNGQRVLLSIARDIAERKRDKETLQQSERRYKRLIESVTDYIYCVQIQDGAPVKTVHGPGCAAVTGYCSEEYEADPHLWLRMVHEEDREAVMSQAGLILSEKSAAPLEHRIVHKSGEVRWVKNTPVPRYNGHQHLVSYDGLVVDITERKLAEQKLKHVAYYDGLTDLPNRELFSDRLRQAQIQARRNGKMLAVLFLDLDRFKSINDTLGHTTGDLLLRSVSARLLHCVREGDTVARLGGDEFIILLTDMARPHAAETVAKKIRQALLKGFTLSGREFFITTSIGISIFPTDGVDVDTLIKNADMAMYQAKAEGRNNHQFYTQAMNAGALRKLILESNMRKAIEREEFILHYQPMVALSSGRIVGAEALVRWQHPELGLLHPSEFIPLAEETGLIIPLGEWVLENGCRQAMAWQKAGHEPLRLSVNLSMRQFAHSAVMGTVSKALEKSAFAPHLLELELTESMIMQNAKLTIATLHELKSAGIQLSLDDFGTGYSSLSYLKNLPLNKLKLDHSFVSALAKESANEAISKAIIDLAHSLKLQVVAEGVETTDQLELLRSLKCDEVQGFLFSNPLCAEDMTRLVNEERERCHQRIIQSAFGGTLSSRRADRRRKACHTLIAPIDGNSPLISP